MLHIAGDRAPAAAEPVADLSLRLPEDTGEKDWIAWVSLPGLPVDAGSAGQQR